MARGNQPLLGDPSTWGQHHDLTGPGRSAGPRPCRSCPMNWARQWHSVPPTLSTSSGDSSKPAWHPDKRNCSSRFRMGDHGRRERTRHNHGARSDRSRTTHHRGIPSREPWAVPL